MFEYYLIVFVHVMFLLFTVVVGDDIINPKQPFKMTDYEFYRALIFLVLLCLVISHWISYAIN